MRSACCLVIILFLLFALPVKGQIRSELSTIDSLIRALPGMMRSDEVIAGKMIHDLEMLSARNKHNHGIINVSFHKSWLSYRKDHVDSAINKIDSALVNIREIEKDTTVAKFYILRGQCYVKKSEMDLAMEDFNKALEIAEKRNDNETRTGVLISIGWAYMETAKYNEAIGFFNEALKLNPSPDFAHRAVLLCNIASCYNTIGDFKTAEEFASAGISIARKRNSTIDIANGLQILARSNYQQGRLEKAIAIQKEASELRKKVSDPAMLAADYLQLADMYVKNNQPGLAIKYARDAEIISYRNANALKLSEAYAVLASAYEASGDYKNAYFYQKRLLEQKDSLAFERYNQAFAQMQVKYESAKQATENLKLREENLESRLLNVSQQRWLIILGAVLLLSIASGIYITNLMRGRYATKLAKEQLKEQETRAIAVMEAGEKERRRIAADLHDGVGQTLAAASLHINKAIKGEGSLEKADQLVIQAGKEVRDLSHQVTPELLIHHGLVHAIEKAVMQLNDAHDSIQFSVFAHQETEHVNDMAALTLYRCFQELSTNIIKHSKANQVNVSINITGEEQQLIVEDNGVGFDLQHLNAGLGIRNMESRIKLYGGTINIDSTPGKGTTTILSIKHSN